MSIISEILDEVKPRLMKKVRSELKDHIVDDLVDEMSEDFQDKVAKRLQDSLDLDEVVSENIDDGDITDAVKNYVSNNINIDDAVEEHVSEDDIKDALDRIDMSFHVSNAISNMETELAKEIDVSDVRKVLRPALRKIILQELELEDTKVG